MDIKEHLNHRNTEEQSFLFLLVSPCLCVSVVNYYLYLYG